MTAIEPSRPQSTKAARARSILRRYEESQAGGELHPAGHAAAASSGLQEWFGDDRDCGGFPPLSVLIGLAWLVLEGNPGQRASWIGRRCWPYPQAMVRRGSNTPDDGLLRRSVYIDAGSREEMIWAAELAARSQSIGVVIADGRGVRMPESRRLHLAATHAGCPVMLARPTHEIGELSAAGTRWRVRPRIGSAQVGRSQTWTVDLLRNKSSTDALFGAPCTGGSARRWFVQRDHASGAISECEVCDRQTRDGDLAAEVVGRSAASA